MNVKTRPYMTGLPPQGLGLTVFFPAFNDAGTIASLVIRAVETARRLTTDYEVIVIDDGSSDATGAVADELAATYPCVRVIHHHRNRGYGGALRAGFAAATKEIVAYTDGDGQYDPAEFEVLWHCLTPDVDFVNGYKIARHDRLHRIVIGRIYHHTVKWLFRLRVRDVDCDFRLMRRAIFDRVRLDSDTGVICLEMMRKCQDAGVRVAEAPVHHYHRTCGRSQFFQVRRLLRTGAGVAKLWVTLVLRPRRWAAGPFRRPTAVKRAPSEAIR